MKVDLYLLNHVQYKCGQLTLEGHGLQHTQLIFSLELGPPKYECEE